MLLEAQRTDAISCIAAAGTLTWLVLALELAHATVDLLDLLVQLRQLSAILL